jgi:DNA polymerase III alpha subunit (gram-positive type)
MTEIYISVDVETDGPIPGPNSMLSLGAAAFLPDGTMVSSYTVNLETLPGAMSDLKTAHWWSTQPDAWEACRCDQVEPGNAMKGFSAWVKHLPGKPVFVGYPAGFDFLFVYWYLIKFTGESPFSFSALDIKSYAAALLNLPYRDATKKTFPKRWWDQVKTKHSHVALDDAIEQGQLFCAMLKDSKKLSQFLTQAILREEAK